MTLQYSDDIANARLDAVETVLGTSPNLEFRTGAQPANTAAADTGTVVSTVVLPADWAAAAAARAKAKSGTWQDLTADNSGTIAHWRLKTSAGVCKLQGSATITGGGGDITLDAVVVTAGQALTVTAFTMNEPNP